MTLQLLHEHVVDETRLQASCAVHAPTNTVFVFGRAGLAAFFSEGHCLCEHHTRTAEFSAIPTGKFLGLFCHVATSTVLLCILPTGSADACVVVFDLQLQHLGTRSLIMHDHDTKELLTVSFSDRFGEWFVATAAEISVFLFNEPARVQSEGLVAVQASRRLQLLGGVKCLSTTFQDATGLLLALVIDSTTKMSQEVHAVDRLTGVQRYRLTLQKQRDVEQVAELICDRFSPVFATLSILKQPQRSEAPIITVWDPSIANTDTHGSVQLPSAQIQLRMASLVSFSNANILVLALVSMDGGLEVWRALRSGTLQPFEMVASGHIHALSSKNNLAQPLGGLAAGSATSGVAVAITIPTHGTPLGFGNEALLVQCIGSQANCSVLVHGALRLPDAARDPVASLHTLHHTSNPADPFLLAVAPTRPVVTLYYGSSADQQRLQQLSVDPTEEFQVTRAAVAHRLQLIVCCAPEGRLRTFSLATGHEIKLSNVEQDPGAPVTALLFVDVFICGSEHVTDGPQLVGCCLFVAHANGDVASMCFDCDWQTWGGWVRREPDGDGVLNTGDSVCGMAICESSAPDAMYIRTRSQGAASNITRQQTSPLVTLSQNGKLKVWRAECSGHAVVTDCKNFVQNCQWLLAGFAQVAPLTSRQCVSFAVDSSGQFGVLGSSTGRIAVWRLPVPVDNIQDASSRGGAALQTTKTASMSVDIHAAAVHALQFQRSDPSHPQGTGISFLCSASADQSVVLWQFAAATAQLEPLIRLWFLVTPLDAMCYSLPGSSAATHPLPAPQLAIRFASDVVRIRVDVRDCKIHVAERDCRRIGCFPLTTTTVPCIPPSASTAIVVYREQELASTKALRPQIPSTIAASTVEVLDEAYTFEASLLAALKQPPIAVTEKPRTRSPSKQTFANDGPTNITKPTPSVTTIGASSTKQALPGGFRMAEDMDASMILPGKYKTQSSVLKPKQPEQPRSKPRPAGKVAAAEVPVVQTARSANSTTQEQQAHNRPPAQEENEMFLSPKRLPPATASTKMRDSVYAGNGFFAAPNMYERNLEQSICRYTASNHVRVFDQRAAAMLQKHAMRSNEQKSRANAARSYGSARYEVAPKRMNNTSPRDARIPALEPARDSAQSLDAEITSDDDSRVDSLDLPLTGEVEDMLFTAGEDAADGVAVGKESAVRQNPHSSRATPQHNSEHDVQQQHCEIFVDACTSTAATFNCFTPSNIRAFLAVTEPSTVLLAGQGGSVTADELAARPGVVAVHTLLSDPSTNMASTTVGNLQENCLYIATIVDSTNGCALSTLSFNTTDHLQIVGGPPIDQSVDVKEEDGHVELLSEDERTTEAAIACTLDGVMQLAISAGYSVPDIEDRVVSEQRAAGRVEQFQRFLNWYFERPEMSDTDTRVKLSPQRVAFREMELSSSLSDERLRKLYEQFGNKQAVQFQTWYRRFVLQGSDRHVREEFLLRLEERAVLVRRSTVLAHVWSNFPCIVGPAPNPSLLLPMLNMLQCPHIPQERRFLLWPSRDPGSFSLEDILSWLSNEDDQLEDNACVDAEAYAREMERLAHFRQCMVLEDKLATQLRSYNNQLAVLDAVQLVENPHQKSFTFLSDLPGEYQVLQQPSLLYALGTGLNNGDEEYDAAKRLEQEQEERRKQAIERRKAELELQRQKAETEMRLKEERDREERMRANAERRKKIRAHLVEVRAQRSSMNQQAQLQQEQLDAAQQLTDTLHRDALAKHELEIFIASEEARELTLMRIEEDTQRQHDAWSSDVMLMSHEDVRSQIHATQWRQDDAYKLSRTRELMELYDVFVPFDFGNDIENLQSGAPTSPSQSGLLAQRRARSRDLNCAPHKETVTEDVNMMTDSFALLNPAAYDSLLMGPSRSAQLRRLLARERAAIQSMDDTIRTLRAARGRSKAMLIGGNASNVLISEHQENRLRSPPQTVEPSVAGPEPPATKSMLRRRRSSASHLMQNTRKSVTPGGADQLQAANIAPRSAYPSGAAKDFRQVLLPPPYVRATFGVAGTTVDSPASVLKKRTKRASIHLAEPMVLPTHAQSQSLNSHARRTSSATMLSRQFSDTHSN